MSNAITTILAAARFYVTLTGAINPSSDNGGIGPSIATVTIAQTVRPDGVVCTPTYSVAFDGNRQYGGVAAHLVTRGRGEWLQALDGLAVAHAAISVEVLDQALPTNGQGIDIEAFDASYGPVAPLAEYVTAPVRVIDGIARPVRTAPVRTVAESHVRTARLAVAAHAGVPAYVAAWMAIYSAVHTFGPDSAEHEAALEATSAAWEAMTAEADTFGMGRIVQRAAGAAVQALHDTMNAV
jgi:hypothetical protein